AGARSAGKRPATTSPQVTAGLKCAPEMCPTAKAIAMTDKPTANAIAIRPACGAENNAEPQTALTSENVPINSAARCRYIATNLPKLERYVKIESLMPCFKNRSARERYSPFSLAPALSASGGGTAMTL